MSDSTPHSAGSQPAEPPHALIERVQARVAEVGLALDRRSTAQRAGRGRRQRATAASSAKGSTSDASREARSLRQVFLELGDAHRQHRLRTGQHGSPALRDAAVAFKRAPSLTSLAVVAGMLDEVGILGW
jgi:hypothetical protein